MSDATSDRSGSDVTCALLTGATIRSEHRPEVTYTVDRTIGRGGFALAVLATRHAPEGRAPVVLKIMRPETVVQDGEMVKRLFKKEVVALGRLNERVPPTPFVVRLLDTGVVSVRQDGRALELPWLCVEHVHGGVEGETLAKRVRYAIQHTGYALDPERVARLVRQLSSALSEVHAAAIVHRDLKPSNVLCCGFGPGEVVKLSDFGIARPTGVVSTFGDLTLGSPGYVAPEQVHLRDEIGPATDVFGFAAVIFFMLTGEKYFDVKSVLDGVLAAAKPERRSLLGTAQLSPELAARPEACRAIDTALAHATAADPRHRFRTASELAASVVPWLVSGPGSGRTSERLVTSVMSARTVPRAPRDPRAWSWALRYGPGSERVVVDVAWESDGHCLVATPAGLSYWDGKEWTDLVPPPVWPIHMVRRLGAGLFLLSTEGGRLHAFTAGEAPLLLSCPEPGRTLTAFAGDLDDIAVMVGVSAGAAPALFTHCGRRWLRPLSVEGAASVPGLTRLDDARWLVTGRTRSGGAFAALFFPLESRLEPLASPDAPALVCCASQPERGVGLAAGGHHVVRVGPAGASDVVLSSRAHGSSCAVDVLGGEWVAGAGSVWFSPGEGAPWAEVWADPAWSAPFVGIHADAQRVVLVSADGGVLEGRAPG